MRDAVGLRVTLLFKCKTELSSLAPRLYKILCVIIKRTCYINTNLRPSRL